MHAVRVVNDGQGAASVGVHGTELGSSGESSRVAAGTHLPSTAQEHSPSSTNCTPKQLVTRARFLLPRRVGFGRDDGSLRRTQGPGWMQSQHFPAPNPGRTK